MKKKNPSYCFFCAWLWTSGPWTWAVSTPTVPPWPPCTIKKIQRSPSPSPDATGFLSTAPRSPASSPTPPPPRPALPIDSTPLSPSSPYPPHSSPPLPIPPPHPPPLSLPAPPRRTHKASAFEPVSSPRLSVGSPFPADLVPCRLDRRTAAFSPPLGRFRRDFPRRKWRGSPGSDPPPCFRRTVLCLRSDLLWSGQRSAQWKLSCHRRRRRRSLWAFRCPLRL